MNEQTASSKTYGPSGWRSIILIRHGATALNSDDHTMDRIRGWTDWPLSEQGREEAQKLAWYIQRPLYILLCSNLTRARQTAEIIAKSLGHAPPKMTEDFLPWDVGDFVGQKSSEVIPILARYVVEAHKVVPGGESFHTFRTRFFKGLLWALRLYPGLVGIVTHHRCERLLKAWAKAEYPENGSINLDEFTLKGKPTGHCEIIEVPVRRLELYEEWTRLQVSG